MHLHAKSLSAEITKEVALRYLLYQPPHYDTREDWPLLLFLHDEEARGEDMEQLTASGPLGRIAAGDDFPFVVASPQCPAGLYWPELCLELKTLIDDLAAAYAIDTSRVYLSGMGMGGYGTWFLAARYPSRFAAIAPMGGGGDWWMVERLKGIPIWAFHGDSDDVVPLIETKVMVNRIRAQGGSARLTVYGEREYAWSRTYNNSELYRWFLEQHR